MKTFAITLSDLLFLNAQVNVPIIGVVKYQTDGTPIYGYTVPSTGFTDPVTGSAVTTDPFTGTALPSAGTVVELGQIGTFDVFNTAWSLFLPPVVTATGTTAAGVGEPFGIRNVQGLFNNISLSSSAIWGAAFYSFARSSDADYDSYVQQRTGNDAFKTQTDVSTASDPFSPSALWSSLTDAQKSIAQGNTNYAVVINDNGSVDLSDRYANPFLSVYDYSPRMISQLVDSQAALERVDAASGGAYITDTITYDLTDINTGETTAVTESFQRNLNTLGGDPSLTGWQVLFGQFFDHGLDKLSSGGNTINGVGAKVYIPLDPSDPLYRAPGTNGPNDPGYTKLSISRATVANPEAAGADGMFRTADDIQSPGADGIYGNADDIVGPTNPNYINHTSPYIDQSQTYGSEDTTTNLLRQWVETSPGSGVYTPGMYLFDGDTLANPWTRTNPDGTTTTTHKTLPTLNELRAELLRTGRDDLSWGDIGNLRVRDASGKVLDIDPNTAGTQAAYTDHVLIADFLPRLDEAHINAEGLTAMSTLFPSYSGNIADYVDVNSGQPTAVGLANQDILNELLLRSIGDHYVAGDGRANENFGLTAIHHVWHEDHNWQIDNLINIIKDQQAADPTHTVAHAFQIDTGNGVDAQGNYKYADGTIAWDQEKMFQASVLIVQSEYQHIAIDQYARGLSPNIPLFVQYDSGVNSDITLDYSQVAFRFGHSQLRETIDTLDPNGSLTGAITHYALEQAFLNPAGFAQVGPTAIALGMTRQFSNEIDEIVTPALQQNLLGQPLDLAAINIARGRDLGMPTLNNLRRELSSGLTTELNALNQKLIANPGDATLKETIDKTIALQAGLQAYSSWADFGANIQHPEGLVNFIAAYSFDGDLAKATVLMKLADSTLFSELTDPAEIAIAIGLFGNLNGDIGYSIKANEFLNGGDQGYEAIDAWNGGLAEKHVFLGQLGSTFDTIFADQMTRLINGDRFYYFWRFQLGLPIFTELNSAISTEQFKDVIERTTGAQHLVGDVFFAADSYVELSEKPNDPNALGDAISGIDRDHKYGDLLDKTSRTNYDGSTTSLLDAAGQHIGVASIGGTNQTLNGYVTERITGKDANGNNIVEKFILDVRPDLGENPDGTAAEGFNAHEVIGGTKFRDYIDAGDGDDTIYSDDGDDILQGNAGADHIYGEGGNDLIYGGSLPDFLDGGIGNDEIHGGDDADVLIGAEGNDTLFGENFTDELHGNAGDDYLDGGLDADFLYGGEGQDIVIGNEGLDTAYGEWGDDRMFGGAGPDQLFGGYGDDILNAGFGGQNQNVNVDEALGEFGFNLVSFSDSIVTLNHSADLNQENINISNVTPFGQLWVNIQGVEGSQFADELIGYNGSGTVDATLIGNWLIGGGGNDKITTGSGDDVIVGDSVRLDALIGTYSGGVLQTNGILDYAYGAGAASSKHFLDLLKSAPDFTFGDTVNITANGLVYTHQAVNGTDTAIYAGDRTNFTITNILAPNSTAVLGYKIVDKTGVESTAQGDIVMGVENFYFNNVLITADELLGKPKLDLHAFDNGNYLETFNTASYTGTDSGGTAPWTTSWTETGDNNSATTGQILITNSQLRFTGGNGNAFNGASILRVADLSGVTSATLSYNYSRQNISGNENVQVQFAADGVNFTTVQTINNTSANNGNSTINLTGPFGASSTVRFVVSALNSTNDRVTIDNVNIDFAKPINDGSNDYATTYTEDAPAVAIASGPSITDVDNTTMASTKVVLTNAKASDVLSISGNLPGGISSSIDTSVAGVITLNLTGNATLAAYQTAISAVRFANTSQAPDTTPRTINVTVNDGVNNSAPATTTVTVVSVDDPTIAGNDILRINAQNTNIIIPKSAFLANDVDPDTVLDITAVSNANSLSNLSLSTNPGSITLSDTGASGGSFSYTVGTATANVSVVLDTGTMSGTNANEIIVDGVGVNNTISGGGGNDIILAGDGNDTITYRIGDGADTIDGGTGNDVLNITGASNNDVLDVIWNGTAITNFEGGTITGVEAINVDLGGSTDTISYAGSSAGVSVNLRTNSASGLNSIVNVSNVTGTAQADTLTGNSGNNILTGGAGADQFVFSSGSAFTTGTFGNDTITDFSTAQGDKIVLSKSSFTALTSAAGGTISSSDFATFSSNSNNSAAGFSARIVYNQNTGDLIYNQNGNTSGFGTGGVFARLTGRPNLTANDLLVQA